MAQTSTKAFCLGKGFPIGAGSVPRCRDMYSTSTGYKESNSASLMTELSAIGSLPQGKKYPIGDIVVSPYIEYDPTDQSIRLTTVFDGPCPNGIREQWAGDPMYWCDVVLTLKD